MPSVWQHSAAEPASGRCGLPVRAVIDVEEYDAPTSSCDHCAHKQMGGGEGMMEVQLELGLDTFGDVTLDADGAALADAQVIRNVIGE